MYLNGMAVCQQNFIYKKQAVGRMWSLGHNLLTTGLNVYQTPTGCRALFQALERQQ